MNYLSINVEKTKQKLVKFIRENVYKSGFKKGVLGLSGGLDSACSAYLAKEALGKQNVLAVIMPYKTTPKQDIKDANETVKTLGIKSKKIEITNMVEQYFKKVKLTDKLRRGNKMARERMSILFDQSKEFKALVIGTSNRTELLLGYGTIYGDMACSLNPLGSLLKTQVFELAKYLKVSANIINKPPSAGFWQGQTDESELGFTYKDVDELIFYMLDRKMKTSDLIKKGFTKDFIEKVKIRINNNKHKRCLPKVAQL